MTNNEHNPHMCEAVQAPSRHMSYQCMLPKEHEDDEHMWYVTWTGEHEGDVME